MTRARWAASRSAYAIQRRLTYRRGLHRGWRWLSHSPRTAILGVFVFTLAASAAVGTGLGILEPRFHDEFSYLLQADTFSRGRLANPTHPHWEHFESFHIFQRPTYASKYQPAQGLVLAIGQVIAGYPMAGSWLAIALMSAAVLWMLQGWLPARWALVGAAITVLHFGIVGYWAQGYWGGAVPATGGALLFGAARRLWTGPRLGAAIWLAIGLVVLAASRPYEGVVVSVPAAILLLVALLRDRARRPEWLARVVTPVVLILALGAAALAVYNRALTGSPLKLPYSNHMEQYASTPNFLWNEPPEQTPASLHPRLRRLYVDVQPDTYLRQSTVRGYLKELGAKAWRVATLVAFGPPYIPIYFRWPSPIWLPLLLIPWLWRRHPWVRFALVTVGALVVAEAAGTYTLGHYFAPVLGLITFLVVMGLRRFIAAAAGLRRRWHGVLATFFAWLLLSLGAGVLVHAQLSGAEALWANQRAALIEALESEGGRHLVFVRYAPDYSIHEEWVFNSADIDSQRVVWARPIDAARDSALRAYYADRTAWSLYLAPREPPSLERLDSPRR